ncbi:MAG: protein kinase [Burkholderiales bacterium]|nr:protein kinase [Burkholderiales bacterium]
MVTAKMKRDFAKTIPNDLRLNRQIGQGGNSVVYSVTSLPDNATYAIKFFVSKVNRYSRFRDEVTVVRKQLSGIQGVLPIVRDHLPKNEEQPWYMMPLAQPLWNSLEAADPSAIRRRFIQLARTLTKIHLLGVAHRDIKPDNLLLWNGLPVFSDFGLADFPNKTNKTPQGEVVGPKWYMAPEMRRNTPNRDSQKADIYSFGKTLWAFLSGNRSGFDGTYIADDGTISLSHSGKCEGAYLTPCHELLRLATANDPDRRPTAGQLADMLEDWDAIEDDWPRKNRMQWEEIENELFGGTSPLRVEWRESEKIVEVLNMVARYNSLNHLFFPDGGGLDLSRCELGLESGTIELHASDVTILKPLRLMFEGFPNSPESNYFRLESCISEPLGEGSVYKGLYEEFVESGAGTYIPRKHWENGTWQGKAKSESCRFIRRYVRGAFVVAPKAGTFNRIDDYLGTFATVSADELRAGIAHLIANASGPQLSLSRSHQHRTIRVVSPVYDKVQDYVPSYLTASSLLSLLSMEKKVASALRKDREARGLSDSLVDSLLGKTEYSRAIRSALLLLGSLSREEYSEYVVIVNFGKNVLGMDCWDADELVVQAIASHPEEPAEYMSAIMHNQFLMKGCRKLGISTKGLKKTGIGNKKPS